MFVRQPDLMLSPLFPKDCLPNCPPSVAQGKRELSADRKSTRLNSSHLVISYAVFCLKKKKITDYLLLVTPTGCATLLHPVFLLKCVLVMWPLRYHRGDHLCSEHTVGCIGDM